MREQPPQRVLCLWHLAESLALIGLSRPSLCANLEFCCDIDPVLS